MQNREEWLNNFKDECKVLFRECNYTIPDNIRMSCGFPKGSRGSQKRIGECWDLSCSKDQTTEIFISPSIDNPLKVAATTIHELIHATVGSKEGHKGQFKTLALAIGLEGKMTATYAGEKLTERLNDIIDKLGKYPHAELNPSSNNGRKKEGTRLLKVTCPECGYNVRITKKWIEQGLPICPCGSEMLLTN